MDNKSEELKKNIYYQQHRSLQSSKQKQDLQSSFSLVDYRNDKENISYSNYQKNIINQSLSDTNSPQDDITLKLNTLKISNYCQKEFWKLMDFSNISLSQKNNLNIGHIKSRVFFDEPSSEQMEQLNQSQCSLSNSGQSLKLNVKRNLFQVQNNVLLDQESKQSLNQNRVSVPIIQLCDIVGEIQNKPRFCEGDNSQGQPQEHAEDLGKPKSLRDSQINNQKYSYIQNSEPNTNSNSSLMDQYSENKGLKDKMEIIDQSDNQTQTICQNLNSFKEQYQQSLNLAEFGSDSQIENIQVQNHISMSDSEEIQIVRRKSQGKRRKIIDQDSEQEHQKQQNGKTNNKKEQQKIEIMPSCGQQEDHNWNRKSEEIISSSAIKQLNRHHNPSSQVFSKKCLASQFQENSQQYLKEQFQHTWRQSSFPDDLKLDPDNPKEVRRSETGTSNKKRNSEFQARKKIRKIRQLKRDSLGNVNPEDLCAVCYDAFKDDIFGQLTCKHQFCFECIMQWAEVATHCPMCRKQFEHIQKKKTSDDDDDEGEIIKVQKQQQRVHGDGEDYDSEDEDDFEFIENDLSDDICYVCGRDNDMTRLLVCDGCLTYCCHTYCDETLDDVEVPSQDWFCHYCRQRSLQYGSEDSEYNL